MIETAVEKNFWRYWLFGLLLFAAMIALNPTLTNGSAPMGISDHQVAGTAAKIDAIQNAWQAAGVLLIARASMAIDLLFIGVYSWGAWNGGKLMRGDASPSVRRIGGVVMAAAVVFLITDYTETLCQFVQVMQMKGSDTLAAAAAMVQPIKSLAWLVTFVGLLAALFLRRMARRSA
jgi:hypothetical protein